MMTVRRNNHYWLLPMVMATVFLLSGFERMATTKVVSSLSLNDGKSSWTDRRAALASLATIPTASVLATSAATTATATAASFLPIMTQPAFAAASSDITTLVIGDPDTAKTVGLEFKDESVGTGGKEYAVVKSVQPGSLAANNGVQEGMVLLGKDSASKANTYNVEFRIRNGPYPFVLQFCNAGTDPSEVTMAAADSSVADERLLLGPYDRMASKVVRKSTDKSALKAKVGDTVTIDFEARITSSGGAMYDSTAWRGGKPSTFVLGKGYALPGVDIGINGMSVGEIKELDIPTTLGYGKFGSQVFDVPGDVRLWWKVELLDVTKGKSKGEWRFK